MSDIVERLAGICEPESYDAKVADEAIEIIKSLRQRVKELEGNIQDVKDEWFKSDQHKESYAEKLESQLAVLQEQNNINAINAMQLSNQLAALKAGQGDPVAWMRNDTLGSVVKVRQEYPEDGWPYQPLYTSSPTIPEGWVMVSHEANKDVLRILDEGIDMPTNESAYDYLKREWAALLIAAAYKPE